jgi:hypothetical protein
MSATTRIPKSSFEDCQGEWVFVNDTIAYATREFNQAVLRIGAVTDIVRVIPEYGQPTTKVQVEVDGRKRWIENTYNVVKLEG